MSRKSVLMCVLTLLTFAYMVFGITVSAKMAKSDKLTGLRVDLSDPNSRFITASDIVEECAIGNITEIDRASFPLYSLDSLLSLSDKIEKVRVNVMSNGMVTVSVTPMVPVARVFDPTHNNESYYINASGKKISADLRYHLDVPVLVGSFDSIRPAERLLPLLDYISTNPEASAMVATVTQDKSGDIILIPNIVGHVINFGDTSMVADKFARLKLFYRHVFPSRGWNKYKSVSVKWRGQIVGTRRDSVAAPVLLPTEEEQAGIYDIDDDDTFLTPTDSSVFAGTDLLKPI